MVVVPIWSILREAEANFSLVSSFVKFQRQRSLSLNRRTTKDLWGFTTTFFYIFLHFLPSSVFLKGSENRIAAHRMRRHWTYRTKKIITHPFGLDLLALIFYTASAEASRGACKGYKNRGSSVMIGIRKFFLLLLLKWGTEHHHLVEASKAQWLRKYPKWSRIKSSHRFSTLDVVEFLLSIFL